MRVASILGLALPLAALCSAAPALASETFPAEVAAKVPGLGCVPQCTLCHFQNPGMLPAGQAFAMTLKAQGVQVIIRDTASVAAALDKLKAASPPPDSDADGVGDYAELEAGTNPNSPDPTDTLCGVGPTYGCGATIAAKPRASSGADITATLAAVFTVLSGLFVLRRRRVARATDE